MSKTWKRSGSAASRPVMPGRTPPSGCPVHTTTVQPSPTPAATASRKPYELPVLKANLGAPALSAGGARPGGGGLSRRIARTCSAASADTSRRPLIHSLCTSASVQACGAWGVGRAGLAEKRPFEARRGQGRRRRARWFSVSGDLGCKQSASETHGEEAEGDRRQGPSPDWTCHPTPARHARNCSFRAEAVKAGRAGRLEARLGRLDREFVRLS